MKSKKRTIAAAALAGMMMIVGFPAAAHATESTPSPEPAAPLTEAQIQQELDSFEVDSLREEMSAVIEQRVHEGEEVVSITYVPFVAEESGDARLAAAPTDCAMSIALTTSPGRVTENAVTSCTTTVPSTTKVELQLVGQNPYNPFDSKVVATNTKYSPNTKSTTSSTFYVCKNTNHTKYVGNARMTLTVAGVNWPTSGADIIPGLNCGY